MDFCFYPDHEYACPEVEHCPHLGGAALSTLVDAASDQGQYLDMLYGQLDSERERNTKLVAENEELKRQLAQVRLELKLERQRQFACGHAAKEDAARSTVPVDDIKTPRKRGAPIGHPGWFRPTPSRYDQLVLVAPPATCPLCGGPVRAFLKYEPQDHLQEDVVGNVHQVVLYRHAAGRCRDCRRWVQQPGPGEILASRIGPRMRALAMYLRNHTGISYRKVPEVLAELLGFSFVPASLIAFEKVLADMAEPVVEDITKKIGSSDGAVHADETYWTLNGERAYYWLHATTHYVHFQFDSSRAGEVSRNVLGTDFTRPITPIRRERNRSAWPTWPAGRMNGSPCPPQVPPITPFSRT